MREQDPFFPNKLKHKKPRSRNANRGRIEIIGDILEVCLDGVARRTHIMYRGNLSYLMLREYTEELIRKSLIEEKNSGSFITTEKGRAFLKHYERIREMLAENESDFDEAVFTQVIPTGSKLLLLGLSKKFLQKIKISDEQERDLVKGILYLREKAKDISDGN
jgi:predicted transcriptional regulator